MAYTNVRDYNKKYITTALFKLMNENDYNNISITDIAKKAGVSRITYYRCFNSKDDIIKQYFYLKMEDYNTSLVYKPRSKEDYYDVIINVLKRMKENKEVFKLLLKANLENLFLDFLNEGFKEDFKDMEIDNSFLSYCYSGMYYNVTIAWVKEDCLTPTKTVAEAIYKVIFGNSNI